MPSLSGTENVVEWIDTIERAGSVAKWSDEDLRKVTRTRIRGEASKFIGHLEIEDIASSWQSLKNLLVDRYGSTGHEELNQYFINTSQQVENIVQEWAQWVGKLSLNSLSDMDLERYLGIEEQTASTSDETDAEESLAKEIEEEHAEEMKRLQKKKERLPLII